jgi:predicted MPP superfamily phosphohydrolase
VPWFAVLLFLLVLGTPTAYVGWRLVRPLPSRRARRLAWAAWIAVPVVTLLEPLRWTLGWMPDSTASRALSWSAYFAMGMFSFILTLTVLKDLLWLALRLADRKHRATSTGFLPEDPERRAFLLNAANAGVVGGAVSLGGVGYLEARRRARVIPVEVPIADLPASLDGFTIAQVSDIHVGPTIGRGYLRAIVDAVNDLDADLVAVTGDLVDGSVERLRADVAPLGELKARHGAFFCTGNHEYYSGVDEWLEEVERLGLTTLKNEHRVLEHGGGRLLVAGVHDYRADTQHPDHTCDPKQACDGAPAADFRLLLAHQPRTARRAAGHGYDLQLSGHTHGGQFFPWNFAIHVFESFVAGLYKHEGMWVYVNRGTGYWGPPIRLGPPSEITHLKLVRA